MVQEESDSVASIAEASIAEAPIADAPITEASIAEAWENRGEEGMMSALSKINELILDVEEADEPEPEDQEEASDNGVSLAGLWADRGSTGLLDALEAINSKLAADESADSSEDVAVEQPSDDIDKKFENPAVRLNMSTAELLREMDRKYYHDEPESDQLSSETQRYLGCLDNKYGADGKADANCSPIRAIEEDDEAESEYEERADDEDDISRYAAQRAPATTVDGLRSGDAVLVNGRQAFVLEMDYPLIFYYFEAEDDPSSERDSWDSWRDYVGDAKAASAVGFRVRHRLATSRNRDSSAYFTLPTVVPITPELRPQMPLSPVNRETSLLPPLEAPPPPGATSETCEGKRSKLCSQLRYRIDDAQEAGGRLTSIVAQKQAELCSANQQVQKVDLQVSMLQMKIEQLEMQKAQIDESAKRQAEIHAPSDQQTIQASHDIMDQARAMLSDLRGKYGSNSEEAASDSAEEYECSNENEKPGDNGELSKEQAGPKKEEEETTKDAADKRSAVLTTSMWGSEVQTQREELRNVMGYLKGKYGDAITSGAKIGSFEC
jgi:hypothetical protein